MQKTLWRRVSPGGLRGLQSRCEARRTSRVCSIRIRLRHFTFAHPNKEKPTELFVAYRDAMFPQLRLELNEPKANHEAFVSRFQDQLVQLQDQDNQAS